MKKKKETVISLRDRMNITSRFLWWLWGAAIVAVAVVASFYLFNAHQPERVKTNSQMSMSKRELETLKYFVSRSDFILIGVVDKVESRWDDDKTQIYTYIDLQIDQLVKGRHSSPKLTIRVIGGKVGQTETGVLTSPPLPIFRVGERVLVFIGKDENGAPLPLTKYTISEEQILGTDIKVADFVRLISSL